jgi:hypothetical protein
MKRQTVTWIVVAIIIVGIIIGILYYDKKGNGNGKGSDYYLKKTIENDWKPHIKKSWGSDFSEEKLTKKAIYQAWNQWKKGKGIMAKNGYTMPTAWEENWEKMRDYYMNNIA